ncbi:hypothetical protein BRADI_4g27456v3 [Brachypodium distachyon]|uniref:Uncharacterized protein n=1 Tax=Brachypodium distachyon TaxID=15368 RepID=A0A0Q3EU09_BRADI|nr:hypothetical protein BRADI_4g27456v3 [Brachypodium distachyon]
METAPRAALEAPPGQPRGGGFFSSPSGRIRRGRVVSAFVLVGGKVCTVCACRGEGSRGGRFLFGLTHIWSMAEYAHARLGSSTPHRVLCFRGFVHPALTGDYTLLLPGRPWRGEHCTGGGPFASVVSQPSILWVTVVWGIWCGWLTLAHIIHTRSLSPGAISNNFWCSFLFSRSIPRNRTCW